jgi:hypothetical protein
MSDLSSKEKLILERFLGMGSGYVLEFSNRTFADFILESVNIEIYEEKYNSGSGSKANRMRSLWDQESNLTIGKVVKDLIDHRRTSAMLNYSEIDGKEELLILECNKIADRLLGDKPVEAIDELKRRSNSSELTILTDSIIESIERNQPQAGLDRLHTYMTNYLRGLCEKHGLTYDKNVPLNSLMGAYIKELVQKSLIESEMTKRILKTSISVLDSFNEVRNEKSFAHDNKILNYDESILIFNNVMNLVKFLNAMGKRAPKVEVPDFSDDISF